MHYLGIDVSSDHLDAELIDQQGQTLQPSWHGANTVGDILKLFEELSSPEETIVVFETTGVYGKTVEYTLVGRVHMVCPVNPKVIKNAAVTMTATKTDRCDALAIARTARTLHMAQPQVLHSYALSEPADDKLALWLGEYDRLRRAIARLKQQTDALAHHPDEAARDIRRSHQRELRQLQRRQDQVRCTVESLAQSESVQQVQSIKGVGLLTAAAVCRKIRTIDRFKSADQLKSYLGIYPAKRQSGKNAGRARLARHGDGLIRHLLFNCAKSAARWNPACKVLYDRLIEKGKSAAYAWVAVMRKLVQIIYGVLKNKTIWKPNYS